MDCWLEDEMQRAFLIIPYKYSDETVCVPGTFMDLVYVERLRGKSFEGNVKTRIVPR